MRGKAETVKDFSVKTLTGRGGCYTARSARSGTEFLNKKRLALRPALVFDVVCGKYVTLQFRNSCPAPWARRNSAMSSRPYNIDQPNAPSPRLSRQFTFACLASRAYMTWKNERRPLRGIWQARRTVSMRAVRPS